ASGPRKTWRFPSMCPTTKPNRTMPVTAITTLRPSVERQKGVLVVIRGVPRFGRCSCRAPARASRKRAAQRADRALEFYTGPLLVRRHVRAVPRLGRRGAEEDAAAIREGAARTVLGLAVEDREGGGELPALVRGEGLLVAPRRLARPRARLPEQL